MPKEVVDAWPAGIKPSTAELNVIGAISRIKATNAKVHGTFNDGSPAITVNAVGQGAATYCAFLPGLSYFHGAIPLRPVDRGSTDDAMAHLIPTRFDPRADALIGWPALGVERAVLTSNKLVQAGVVQSKSATAIVLTNWTAGPVKGLKVSVPFSTTGTAAKSATLAGGGKVETTIDQEKKQAVYTLDLDVADALILR